MTNKEAVIWIMNLSADIGKIEHQDLWHYEQALYEIREMLDNLPSAQPEVLACGSGEPKNETGMRWIPCNERLPNEMGAYLVTFNYNDGNATASLWWHSETNEWAYDMNDSVIAWMPLPEPYNGGEQDAK